MTSAPQATRGSLYRSSLSGEGPGMVEMRRSFEKDLAKTVGTQAKKHLQTYQTLAITQLSANKWNAKTQTLHLDAYIAKQIKISSPKLLLTAPPSRLEGLLSYKVTATIFSFLDTLSFIKTRSVSRTLQSWSTPHATSIWFEKTEQDKEWQEIASRRSYEESTVRAHLIFACCRLATFVRNAESGIAEDLFRLLPNNGFSTRLSANALMVAAQHQKLETLPLAHVHLPAIQLAKEKATLSGSDKLFTAIDEIFQTRVRGQVVILATQSGKCLDLDVIKMSFKSGPVLKEDREKALAIANTIAKRKSSTVQESEIEDPGLLPANRKELVNALSGEQSRCIIA